MAIRSIALPIVVGLAFVGLGLNCSSPSPPVVDSMWRTCSALAYQEVMEMGHEGELVSAPEIPAIYRITNQTGLSPEVGDYEDERLNEGLRALDLVCEPLFPSIRSCNPDRISGIAISPLAQLSTGEFVAHIEVRNSESVNWGRLYMAVFELDRNARWTCTFLEGSKYYPIQKISR